MILETVRDDTNFLHIFITLSTVSFTVSNQERFKKIINLIIVNIQIFIPNYIIMNLYDINLDFSQKQIHTNTYTHTRTHTHYEENTRLAFSTRGVYRRLGSASATQRVAGKSPRVILFCRSRCTSSRRLQYCGLHPHLATGRTPSSNARFSKHCKTPLAGRAVYERFRRGGRWRQAPIPVL